VRTILPHTADLRAEIRAPDLVALYAEAAGLVREILVGGSAVAARETRRIALAGGDDSERLFRFVRELLYLADSERFLPAAATLEADEVTVDGEPFDAARHVAERQVKAVTRHGFELERAADGSWRCRMVFDL
jgi:SHS2 domain-containing protein